MVPKKVELRHTFCSLFTTKSIVSEMSQEAQVFQRRLTVAIAPAAPLASTRGHHNRNPEPNEHGHAVTSTGTESLEQEACHPNLDFKEVLSPPDL